MHWVRYQGWDLPGGERCHKSGVATYEPFAVVWVQYWASSCLALLKTTWSLKPTNTSPTALFLLLQIWCYSSHSFCHQLFLFLAFVVVVSNRNSPGRTCFSSRLVPPFCICFSPVICSPAREGASVLSCCCSAGHWKVSWEANLQQRWFISSIKP